jgi:hypothetical protein
MALFSSFVIVFWPFKCERSLFVEVWNKKESLTYLVAMTILSRMAAFSANFIKKKTAPFTKAKVNRATYTTKFSSFEITDMAF